FALKTAPSKGRFVLEQPFRILIQRIANALPIGPTHFFVLLMCLLPLLLRLGIGQHGVGDEDRQPVDGARLAHCQVLAHAGAGHDDATLAAEFTWECVEVFIATHGYTLPSLEN